ncbi:MAG: ABC transporter substrate-binding protein [Proteobacteria bacterium]|nr:ABC transporter substrate-binding protein [Pseudomonadota bacterium]
MAFGACPIQAASASGDASAFVLDLGKKATRVLSTKRMNLAEREAKFQSILFTNFNVPAIGRFALGQYWRQASSEQKNDYLELFGKFIVQNYASKLGGYSGENLKVISETPLKNKIDILVNTRVERPSGPPINITWRVRSRDQSRQIVDIMVEGISLALTQRQQFASVVSQHGLQGLLETLRARTTKASAKQLSSAE